jgi:hypothetical protein
MQVPRYIMVLLLSKMLEREELHDSQSRERVKYGHESRGTRNNLPDLTRLKMLVGRLNYVCPAVA